MVRDLREAWEWIGRLTRRVERVESGAFLENSSITAGRMRFIGGLLLIDSGGQLTVVGTASVTGTLTGSGTFDWTGPMNLQGAQTITGPTTFTGQMTVNGPWKFVGNGQITGDVDVTGNIKVLPGGKIQVGNIVIDPTISGGAVTFANGAQVFTDASTIQVFKGGSVVQISDDYARLQSPYGVISTSSDGVRLTGYGTVNVADVPGAFVGAAILDSSGYLKKVVS